MFVPSSFSYDRQKQKYGLSHALFCPSNPFDALVYNVSFSDENWCFRKKKSMGNSKKKKKK